MGEQPNRQSSKVRRMIPASKGLVVHLLPLVLAGVCSVAAAATGNQPRAGLPGWPARQLPGPKAQAARQDAIALTTHIDAQAIGTNLPEIVHPLLAPLFALFDFFDLPMDLVVEELNRMKAGNY
jgi:hypothetical protein